MKPEDLRLYFTFADGSLGYDCVACGFKCCSGYGFGATQSEYAWLVERYPAHPLSAAAYRWLIRHDSSSEVRRRYELKHFVGKGKFELIGGDKDFEQWVGKVIAFVERPAAGLNLPLHVQGTAFQQRVWKKLCEIPSGTPVFAPLERTAMPSPSSGSKETSVRMPRLKPPEWLQRTWPSSS